MGNTVETSNGGEGGQVPPVLDADLAPWSENLPEAFRRLRETAAVCRAAGQSHYLIGRYSDVREALTDWKRFSVSGDSTGSLSEAVLADTVLKTDPPAHGRLKAIMMRPLSPVRVKAMQETIQAAAEEAVERACQAGEIDVATDLAPILPNLLVRSLVGLPEEGRQQMHAWGEAITLASGARGDQNHPWYIQAKPIVDEMLGYFEDPALPGKLIAGGWAAEAYKAVEAGELT